MKLDGKRILITGADGFIGSHLTERLVRRGCDVRAFVQYNSLGSWGWLDGSEADIQRHLDVFAGDIRDPHGVRTAMTGCDVVLHLAALIAIPYSYHSPQTYVETNVLGTLNVVQAARAAERAGFACLRLAKSGADRDGEDFYHAGLREDVEAAVASDALRRFSRDAARSCSRLPAEMSSAAAGSTLTFSHSSSSGQNTLSRTGCFACR